MDTRNDMDTTKCNQIQSQNESLRQFGEEMNPISKEQYYPIIPEQNKCFEREERKINSRCKS